MNDELLRRSYAMELANQRTEYRRALDDVAGALASLQAGLAEGDQPAAGGTLRTLVAAAAEAYQRGALATLERVPFLLPNGETEEN